MFFVLRMACCIMMGIKGSVMLVSSVIECSRLTRWPALRYFAQIEQTSIDVVFYLYQHKMS